MKLFKYESYQVTIEPEALLLKPFKVIWNRDRSKTKQTAMNELGFVYFFTDPRSDYQYITDEDERINAIREGEGLPDKWKPDSKVLDAIEFYKQFKPTSALLLDATRVIVSKLIDHMKTIDLEDVDKNGKPIYALNTVTATIDKVPSLVIKLDEAEKAVASDLRAEGRMRGQGEKTVFEDNLSI